LTAPWVTVWIGSEADGQLGWRSESHETSDAADEVGHAACRAALAGGKDVVVLFEQDGKVASFMVTFADDPDVAPWWSHRECAPIALRKAKASAWELEPTNVVGNHEPSGDISLEPLEDKPEPADAVTLALVAELDQKAARDVLARSVHIQIGRDTVMNLIVSQVCDALTEGRCVRLGRLALQAWPDSPVVRDLASDDDGARNDPEKWAATARIRQTLSVAGDDGEKDVERLAQAFVAAWSGDWSKRAAPAVVVPVEA
jgi:hypothetical protein